MNFAETAAYLEALGEARMRLDLEPSRRLLELIGRPDRKLRSVCVGGTNGKGSVCAYLTAIAGAAGCRVGTFTSPHVESVRERVAINGKPLEEDAFAAAGTEVRHVIERNRFEGVTYFEFLTMLAARAFANARVDLAVFEAGLGGRLDATNTLEREGVVITAIDFDHMQTLGDTLEKIAAEKGALLRGGAFGVLAAQKREAEAVLLACAKTGTEVLFSDRDFSATGTWDSFCFEFGDLRLGPCRLGLRGTGQVQNAACAAAAALALNHRGFSFSADAIAAGLKNAFAPCRMELRHAPDGREVWLDVAHNRGAVSHLVDFLSTGGRRGFHAVVGILADKEWRFMLEQLSTVADEITLCRPASPRAWDLKEAEAAAQNLFPIVHVVEEPAPAFHCALQGHKPLLCAGSFYVLSPILAGTEGNFLRC